MAKILSLEEALKRSIPLKLVDGALFQMFNRERPERYRAANLLKNMGGFSEEDSRLYEQYAEEDGRKAEDALIDLVKRIMQEKPQYYSISVGSLNMSENLRRECPDLTDTRLSVDIRDWMNAYEMLVKDTLKVYDLVSRMNPEIATLIKEHYVPGESEEDKRQGRLDLVRRLVGLSNVGFDIMADEKDYKKINEYISKEILAPSFTLEADGSRYVYNKTKLDSDGFFDAGFIIDNRPTHTQFPTRISAGDSFTLESNQEANIIVCEGLRCFVERLMNCHYVKGIEIRAGASLFIPTYERNEGTNLK